MNEIFQRYKNLRAELKQASHERELAQSIECGKEDDLHKVVQEIIPTLFSEVTWFFTEDYEEFGLRCDYDELRAASDKFLIPEIKNHLGGTFEISGDVYYNDFKLMIHPSAFEAVKNTFKLKIDTSELDSIITREEERLNALREIKKAIG